MTDRRNDWSLQWQVDGADRDLRNHGGHRTSLTWFIVLFDFVADANDMGSSKLLL